MLNTAYIALKIDFCSRHSLLVILFNPLSLIKLVHCATWKLFLKSIPHVALGFLRKAFFIFCKTKFLSSSVFSKICPETAFSLSGFLPSTGFIRIWKNASFVSSLISDESRRLFASSQTSFVQRCEQFMLTFWLSAMNFLKPFTSAFVKVVVIA